MLSPRNCGLLVQCHALVVRCLHGWCCLMFVAFLCSLIVPWDRSLYKFLSSMQSLSGVWRSESTARGCLYVFAWQADCIAGRELSYDSMKQPPLSAPFVRIGPASRASAQLIGSNCVLKQTSIPSKASSSATAEACAAVAMGSIRSVTSSFSR